jgi:hypothetical protein
MSAHVQTAVVTPHVAPLPDQTWETFSRNWHTDTRHVFTWMRQHSARRWPRAAWSS